MKINSNIIKGLIWGIIICAIIAMCTSCRTKYVSVPEYHEVYISQVDTFQSRDSIYLHDSVYCALKGDTMYIERYNTKFIEKLKYISKTDTICKTDSIVKPVYIEKELSFTQKLFNKLGLLTFLVVLMGAAAWLIKRRWF